MKLNKIITIEGQIKIMTGLHIGAGNTEMHIGGLDNPVIKHPYTFEPYIPGSSLKGKVRSLLELHSGIKLINGKPLSTKIINDDLNKDKDKTFAENIIKLFGMGGSEQDEDGKYGPTRVAFRDCYLNEEFKKEAVKNRGFFTELKTENTINRITSTAETPRTTERVPEGAVFDFQISLKLFDEDKEKELINTLLKGMKLVEMDGLGGSVSRGYGRIKFTFKDSEIQSNFDATTIGQDESSKKG